MGIYGGSFSFTRYRLIGEHNIDFSELDRLAKRYQIKPIQLGMSAPKELVYGWAPAGTHTENLPSDSHWSLSDGSVGDGLLLRIRLEKRIVSRSLLRSMHIDAMSAAEQKTKKSLSRQDRKALWDEIAQELLSQALPSLSFIDLYWRFSSSQVYVFSTASKALEIAEELFRKTFASALGFSMIKIMPPLLGLTDAEWYGKESVDSRVEELRQLRPGMKNKLISEPVAAPPN